MPFDRDSEYLTWGGRLSTAAEDYWQCGIRFAFDTNAFVPPAFTSGMLEDAADALSAFHTAAGTGICTGAKLDWVKAASLDEEGAYRNEPVVLDGIDASGGGAGGSAAGPSVSVAVTLWSGSTFGQANYGRFYLPWQTSLVTATDGKMTDVTRDAIVSNAQTLLNALFDIGAAAPGANDLLPSIMSSVGAGTTKVISQVRVGNVKDTQRRRSNRLDESYGSAPVA